MLQSACLQKLGLRLGGKQDEIQVAGSQEKRREALRFGLVGGVSMKLERSSRGRRLRGDVESCCERVV